MKTGQIIRPAGRISTIAEVNEARADMVPVDYGFTPRPKVTWDGEDLVLSEPKTLDPVAAFVAKVTNLKVDVDGSASFDEDSPTTAAPLVLEWLWGDGATSTGKTATHTYTTAGNKTISLMVTDASGALGEISQVVTVTAPAV